MLIISFIYFNQQPSIRKALLSRTNWIFFWRIIFTTHENYN